MRNKCLQMQSITQVNKMNIPNGFVVYIEDNCDVDEIDGELRCKKCGCKVVIDWFEKELECQGCDEL